MQLAMKHWPIGAALAVLLATAGDVRYLLYLISVGPVQVDTPVRVVVHSILALAALLYLYLAWRRSKSTQPS